MRVCTMKRNTGMVTAVCFAVALAISLSGQTNPNPNPPVNRNSAISVDFDKRIAQYMKIHQQAQTGLTTPKSTGSPEQVVAFQHQLAAKIRQLRSSAKQGDIFTPEITSLFRHLVSTAMKSANGTKIRSSFQHAEPIKGLHLGINESYPDSVPLQSMPPSLLLNLPKLPKELEYRFVGRELVLRDVPANVVVDFIPDVSLRTNQ
jgi:hypothetical protein